MCFWRLSLSAQSLPLFFNKKAPKNKSIFNSPRAVIRPSHTCPQTGALLVVNAEILSDHIVLNKIYIFIPFKEIHHCLKFWFSPSSFCFNRTCRPSCFSTCDSYRRFHISLLMLSVIVVWCWAGWSFVWDWPQNEILHCFVYFIPPKFRWWCSHTHAYARGRNV